MAWNPQGGGQGPWGRGPAGPQPPDIEELLRRGQDRVRRILPGGLGGGKGYAIIGLVLVAVWLLSGLYRVETAEQGVVMLFGRYDHTTGPGLHLFFPAPIGRVLTPNVEQINRVEVGFRGGAESARAVRTADVPEESLMLTGDQNIADLDFTVFWKIRDAPDYLFNVRDPEETVKKAAESAMREVIGQSNLEDALTGGRSEIQARGETLLQDILDIYKAGILITEVQLLKVDPPKPVIDAFNEVQRARQDKERKQNEAEAYRNKIVPTARGEAEQLIQGALALKEKAVKDAEGEANRFLALYETYKVAKDVTTQRLYLEALEDVMQGANKVIIDGGVGGGQGGGGVVPYLPLNELMRRPNQENRQ